MGPGEYLIDMAVDGDENAVKKLYNIYGKEFADKFLEQQRAKKSLRVKLNVEQI